MKIENIFKSEENIFGRAWKKNGSWLHFLRDFSRFDTENYTENCPQLEEKKIILKNLERKENWNLNYGKEYCKNKQKNVSSI